MGKKLLVFIQSQTIDVYVNVLTHCVTNEGVRAIYFVGREESVGANFRLLEIIARIRDRIGQLAREHPEYVPAREYMPTSAQAGNCLIRLVFVRPQDAIRELKERFPDTNDLIVDVTGCKKRLATDVTTTFIANGIDHVCHFQLADKVFSPEWRELGRKKLYHDLTMDGITYYEYDDFSECGATISTLDRLRAKGAWTKRLVVLSAMLSVTSLVLASLKQTQVAQVASVLFSGIGVLALLLGILEDTFSLVERLRR